MRLEEIKCPNCGGSNVSKIDARMVKCDYCNTTFTIDYDPEDAAMDKNRADIIMQRERLAHQEKMIKSSKRKTMALLFTSLVVVTAFCSMIYLNLRSEQQSQNSDDSISEEKEAVIYEMGFVESLSEIPESYYEKLEETAYKAISSEYTLSSASMQDEPELSGVYLLTNKNDSSNMLYFSYHVVWERTLGNESVETQDIYPAFYFEDIKLMSDGSIKSDYIAIDGNPSVIFGNTFIYGYDSQDDFYKKCILSNPEYNVEEK